MKYFLVFDSEVVFGVYVCTVFKNTDMSGMVHSLHLPMQYFLVFEDVPPVEFMYLVSTSMPGESYRRRLRSLLLYLRSVY